MLRDYLNGFDSEGLGSVLGEHADEDIVHYFGFSAVGSCDIYEDVVGFQGDFAVIRVDDGGHGAYCPIRIKNHRVDWRRPDYGQIAREVFVVLRVWSASSLRNFVLSFILHKISLSRSHPMILFGSEAQILCLLAVELRM